MSSRRYLKRVWRVPKDRGPVEYLATLLVKALRKHGWPADWKAAIGDNQSFYIVHKERGKNYPRDFAEAMEIAVRVTARAYRIDVTEFDGFITLNKPYRVTMPGGQFKEINDASPADCY